MSPIQNNTGQDLPQHVAIIMDGNGRWAKKRGKLRTFGHEHGVKAVRETVEIAAEIGIKYITLFAFSTENWKRPKWEVDTLMSLLVKSIHAELPTLMKNNIQLRAIGDIESLEKNCKKQLAEAIEQTSQNTRMTLVLALSYSSRWEITEACRKIAIEVQKGNLKANEINEDTITSFLTTNSIPDPELLIRTSGEYRISNFLMWQISYSELYFTPKLWPDFGKEDFLEAIEDYKHRERRFGLTSEQIK
ncbi:MAG: isoprenyl transferase [Bacteroidota bacterium]